jgi:chaperonin GroES
MKIQPLNDRVLVRRVAEDNKIRGGIIIPDTAKEKPMQGEVVATGPGERQKEGGRRPMSVKEGDRVLFGKYSGSEIKVDGEELLLVREEEILAIID